MVMVSREVYILRENTKSWKTEMKNTFDVSIIVWGDIAQEIISELKDMTVDYSKT